MAKIYSKEGNLLYEGELSNNKPLGRGQIFWPNGTIYMEGEFGIKGLVQGIVYNKDGIKRFEGCFGVNRGYGPNYPIRGTLYDEKGEEIYKGEVTCKKSGLGLVPKGFETHEYKIPIEPYMWDDTIIGDVID